MFSSQRRPTGLRSGTIGVIGFACAALFALGACPDDGSPGVDAADVGDALPGGRTFLFAARAEGYDPSQARPFVASLEAVTLPASASAQPPPTDPVTGQPLPDRPIEALVLPVDLLGIPWTAFTGPDHRPAQLPGAWLKRIEALEALAAEAGLPVILAVSPLSSEHDTLAPLASDEASTLVLNPTWKPSCYDPSADANPTLHRDQFAGYVVWLAERFRPRAIVLGQRLNLYEANCSARAFSAVVGFVNHAHGRLGATSTVTVKPLTIASFDVEDLYGFPPRAGRCVSTTPKGCLATRAALLADLAVDHLGLESEPWRAFGDLSTIPSDWLSAVAAAQPGPRLRALVASTGVPALRMDALRGVCSPFIESDGAAQRRWLDQALAFSSAERAPFLVWRSLKDRGDSAVLQSCPCSGDPTLCAHLNGLGNRRDDRRAALASGLVDSTGTPREALALWRSLLAPR